MDRNIVYPGSIPLDTDLLGTNRNAMVALGALMRATLGTDSVYDGLAVTPDVPASLTVWVAPGSITQLTSVDQNAYGSLAADSADPLMKMGVNLVRTPLTLTAPTTSGQSILYLVEAAFVEADVAPVVLPYYNAANPAQPYLGPDNNGVAQATLREQRVQIQLKASAASTTPAIPAVDSGWVGLAVVSVAYGQTQITSGNIQTLPGVSGLVYKLPDLRPGFSNIAVFTTSGTMVIPTGVTRVKVTVTGGGGAGGTHASLPGGGGGAGGVAIGIFDGLTPGQSIAVTVGAGGAPSASPSPGGNGGTSSFGALMSATGGAGGGGGSGGVVAPGSAGGTGAGGAINIAGAFGGDATVVAQRGGDGGGPGNGRGTTGSVTGISAPGYGGGGGGSGSTMPDGSGTGGVGGAGGPGLVVVEH